MKDETEDDYKPNYTSNSCWLFRFLFFTHLIPMVTHIRKTLAGKPIQEQGIDVEDTPGIKYEESCKKLAQDFQ